MSLEEEESFLNQANFIEYKEKFNVFIEKRDR
jgi:hypothetical protein